MELLTVNNKNTYTGSDLNFSQISDKFLRFVFRFHSFGYTYSNENVSAEYPILNENELTLLCMQASEQSLKDAWDNEDDERWNSFLNENK